MWIDINISGGDKKVNDPISLAINKNKEVNEKVYFLNR